MDKNINMLNFMKKGKKTKATKALHMYLAHQENRMNVLKTQINYIRIFFILNIENYC